MNKNLLRYVVAVTVLIFIGLGIFMWQINKKPDVSGLQSHQIKTILMPSPKVVDAPIVHAPAALTPQPAYSSSAISQSFIDCTGPDGKHLWVTKDECDSFNSSWATPTPIDTNPTVACQLNSNCGNGVQYVKKSVCDEITCCQVGSTWAIYPSKESCIDAQNKLQPTPTSTPTPTFTPTPTPLNKIELLKQCLNQAILIYQNTNCEGITGCLANRYQIYQNNVKICNLTYF
jgi:hypothetical protein